MKKTEVAGFLAGVFDGVEKSRYFPRRFKATIEQIKSKVMGAETLITDGLPETFSAQDVIDKLFTLAEAWVPSATIELEVLKWVVDRFLATPPAAA